MTVSRVTQCVERRWPHPRFFCERHGETNHVLESPEGHLICCECEPERALMLTRPQLRSA